MTETDTSRETVEGLAQSADAWGEVNLTQGRLGQSDDMAKYADTLHALLARAEKAEAERDTAWNDAIEAAASKARIHNLGRDYEMSQRQINAILALKKEADQ